MCQFKCRILNDDGRVLHVQEALAFVTNKAQKVAGKPLEITWGYILLAEFRLDSGYFLPDPLGRLQFVGSCSTSSNRHPGAQIQLAVWKAVGRGINGWNLRTEQKAILLDDAWWFSSYAWGGCAQRCLMCFFHIDSLFQAALLTRLAIHLRSVFNKDW